MEVAYTSCGKLAALKMASLSEELRRGARRGSPLERIVEAAVLSALSAAEFYASCVEAGAPRELCIKVLKETVSCAKAAESRAVNTMIRVIDMYKNDTERLKEVLSEELAKELQRLPPKTPVELRPARRAK